MATLYGVLMRSLSTLVLLSACLIALVGCSSNSKTPTVPLSVTVSPSGAPAGTQGAAYSYALQNTGGVAPFAWSLTAGSLPTGLGLNSASGVISGTPTAGGNFSSTVTVTDSGNPKSTATAVLNFAIASNPNSVHITTSSLDTATQNIAFSDTFAAAGGNGSYTWSLATGALPTGITLSSAGVLSGTPTAAGTFSFTVAVQDSATPPGSSSASFVLTVNPPGALTITTTTLADADMGGPYQIVLQATGGKAPYLWSIDSGSLPPGTTLASGQSSVLGGTLGGTPSASGVYTFTVKVTDSTSPTVQTATKSFSLKINALSGTNNSWLNGHYAFYMVGFTDPGSCSPFPSPVADQPMTMTGSFVADGNGNVLQGEYDSSVCGNSTTQHNFTGTYSVNADQRGKLVMNSVINGQSTFAFSVEQIQGGVAQQAQLIEFDDTSGDVTGSRGSGIMQLQTPSDFTVASLDGNYVYGLAGSAPSAGLLIFNGSGGVTGPSVSGSYGTTDTIFGRTTFNINSTNYVMYMVNAQQAFITATGSASTSAGQMRLQQSATFSNASLNNALVGYGVTPIPTGGTSFVGGVRLFSVDADGTGNLTGTLDIGSHYGPSPFTTTYSVSSNGLALLGTGDVVWLYGPNAGYGTSGGALMTYETAAGGPFTFDVTTGPYAVGTLPPAAGNAVLESGSYLYAGSGNATVSLDYSIGSLPVLPAGTSTSTTTVPINALPVCVFPCSTPIALSATRAISLQESSSANSLPSPTVLIFQK
jgi:hypothetical protein